MLLEKVYQFIDCGQNKVVQVILTRLLIDICLAEEHLPVARWYQRWWEKDILDLKEMREVARET